MAKVHGGDKFIGRNRPPRVQIECDEECYGAQIKVNLPFVAGVMADLSGNWEEFKDVPSEHVTARGEMEKRKFLEISQDNFEDRMKAMKPTVTFTVPNTLTPEGGNFAVNLTFEKMEDFSPDKIAERIEPLKKLLETRKTLKYLKNNAQGKASLEKLLQKIVDQPELAAAIVAAAKMDSSKSVTATN